ncbi:MAG: dephospho-CoA kinase [Bacillus sp. (in: firmicutes)]
MGKTVIGITGGIASGKSTVSNMIKELGFTVIDADIAARKVVEPGEKAYEAIIEVFGEEICLEDKTINRELLGSIVFNNEEKRLLLNSIVHPAVREYMNREKQTAFEKGAKVVFLDIPLLFESKLTYMVDKTLLVYVNRENQLVRLMQRNGLSEQAAEARINSQMPLDDKKAWADEVVDNNQGIDETKYQLYRILEKWGVPIKRV